MAQATISDTIVEPTMAHIVSVGFDGDFSDSTKMRLHCQVLLRKDDGSEYERVTVNVPLSDAAMEDVRSKIETAILPKTVDAVETLLGVTFA